jgi:hypothetical protein
LEGDEEDQDRDGDHRGVGHHLAPGGVELEEVLDADLHRAQLLLLHHHERPQVGVPGGQEGQDGDRGERRAGEWHDHLAVDAEPAAAVNAGGLVEFARYRREVLGEQEDREGVGDERHDLDAVGVHPSLF